MLGELIATGGKKLVATVLGCAAFIGVMTVKGWLTGSGGRGEAPSAWVGPIPAAKMALDVEGAAVVLESWQATIDHMDDGTLWLSFEGPGMDFRGPMDLNGDGKANRKDVFDADPDDVTVNAAFLNRAFEVKTRAYRDDKATLTLPGKPAVEILRMKVTPKTWQRPKDYNGSEGWSGDIELVLKTESGEKTWRGTFEGPVIHTW